MNSEQPNRAGCITNKFERWFYLLSGGVLFVGWIGYLWGRDAFSTSVEDLGPLSITGTAVVIPFSLALIVLSAKRSYYARLITMSMVSITLSLGILEGVLQVCGCSPTYATRGIALWEKVRENRIDTIVGLQEQGIEAYPFVPMGLLHEIAAQSESELFLSNVGNALMVMQEEDDGVIITAADEIGFRNPAGLFSQNDSFDVFLLGDSFTEGCCVPDGYTIADQLRKTTSYSVYNGGKSGSGLLHQLAIFIEYGLNKRPKAVVIVLPESMILSRAAKEIQTEQLRQYYEEHKSKDLVSKSGLKDDLLKTEIDLRLTAAVTPVRSFVGELTHTINSKSLLVNLIHSNNALSDALRLSWARGSNTNTEVVKGNPFQGEGVVRCSQTPNHKAIMTEVASWMNQQIQGYGGSLYIVYMPAVRFYGYLDWPECEHEMVISVTQELGIPLIDMVPVFDSVDDPKDYFAFSPVVATVGGHPNRYGYQLMTEQIVKHLRDRD